LEGCISIFVGDIMAIVIWKEELIFAVITFTNALLQNFLGDLFMGLKPFFFLQLFRSSIQNG
jgi:hypothetical protein